MLSNVPRAALLPAKPTGLCLHVKRRVASKNIGDAFPNSQIILRFLRKSVVVPLLICFLLLTHDTRANVIITKPSLSLYACGGSYPTSYGTLGDIVITEGANNDFNTGSGTLILSAPSNFQFNAGIGSVTFAANKNITSATILVTTTTITITL